MAQKQIALELAAFLDSEPARELTAPRGDAKKKIAAAFLTVAWEELGKEPWKFDGQDLHAAVGEHLPGHFAPRDPLAAHVPSVLEAYFEHLEATQVVTQSFEIRQAWEPALAAFAAAVRAGTTPRRAPAKQTPLVHRAPKLGRNDPCFCGSGKKFKKCHGKDE